MGKKLRYLAMGAAMATAVAFVPATQSGAADEATVYVVHGIPSVGNVDVCANGSIELLSNVPFGGVAPVEVAAGTYDLTVLAAADGTCVGPPLITLNGAAIAANANISVVANLTGGTPNLAVYENDVEPVAAGSGRVAVYHAANAPTVDVLVNGGPGIDDLAQGDVASADLPAGAYTFTVTSADGSVTVATLEGVEIPEGQLVQVFAVGAFPDESGENPFQVVDNVVALQVTPASTTSTVAPATTAAPAAAPHSQPRFTG